MRKNHFVLALLGVGMMLSAVACDDKEQDLGQSQYGLDCLKIVDPGIDAYAKANWDANADNCITEAEAAAVTTIPDNAFAGDLQVKSVEDLNQFPNLTSIGSSAFAGCSNLTEVDLSHVDSIGALAFADCTSLVSVSLPESATIADDAFEGCENLDPSNIHKTGCVTGNKKCSDNKTQSLICQNNTYVLDTTCNDADGEVCKESSGECESESTGEECTTGAYKCSDDSSQSLICDDNEWMPIMTCSSGACIAETGMCRICTEGARKCSLNGGQSLVCNNNNWVVDKECGEDACIAETGLCCTDGTFKCSQDGSQSLICNNNEWTTATTCDSTMCVEETGQCDLCTSSLEGEHRCSADRTQSLVCNNNEWQSDENCGADKDCNQKTGLCELITPNEHGYYYCGNKTVSDVTLLYDMDLSMCGDDYFGGGNIQEYSQYISNNGGTSPYESWCKSVNPQSTGICWNFEDDDEPYGTCLVECSEADLGNKFEKCFPVVGNSYIIGNIDPQFWEMREKDYSFGFVCQKIGNRYAYVIDETVPVLSEYTCEYPDNQEIRDRCNKMFGRVEESTSWLLSTFCCPDNCTAGCNSDGTCKCQAACGNSCEENGECWIAPECPSSCVNGCYADGSCKNNVPTPNCTETQCAIGTGACLNYDTIYHFKKARWNITEDFLEFGYPFADHMSINSTYSSKEVCQIDWGDGVETTVTFSAHYDQQLGYEVELTGSRHKYRHPGVYTISTNCPFNLAYRSNNCITECEPTHHQPDCEIIECFPSQHSEMCAGWDHIIEIIE